MLQELRRVDALLDEGDLVAAQRMCKRLLQQHPTNASVHEKMGDVMRRRQLWEDAAEWYDLAAQLHETEALKAKRADVVQRAREERQDEPEPHLVDDADSPRRLMMWLGIAAAAMLLVVVGVIWSIARGGGEETDRPTISRTVDTDGPTRTTPQLNQPSPVRGTRDVPTAGRPVQSVPRATSNPQEHWTATQMPRPAPRRAIRSRSTTGISAGSPDPTTDHDQAVVNAISSLTWGDERPMTGRVRAMVDPYSGYAMISVTIPRAIEEDGLVEEVVRQAWRVAVATVRADEVIEAMTVRMIRVTEDGERVVAFRGNTTRAALRTLEVDRPNFETLWNQVFATAWWNPRVGGDPPAVAEGEPAQTNGAS